MCYHTSGLVLDDVLADAVLVALGDCEDVLLSDALVLGDSETLPDELSLGKGVALVDPNSVGATELDGVGRLHWYCGYAQCTQSIPFPPIEREPKFTAKPPGIVKSLTYSCARKSMFISCGL